jgi:hypothetical protein
LRINRKHVCLGCCICRARRIRCAVILPAGKIASGKLVQAVAHGARIVSIDGNFDDALRIVRELGDKGEFAIVNSINPIESPDKKRPRSRLSMNSATRPTFTFFRLAMLETSPPMPPVIRNTDNSAKRGCCRG